MQPAFHRLLSLLANEIVMKAMDIIGSDLLINPIKVHIPKSPYDYRTHGTYF